VKEEEKERKKERIRKKREESVGNKPWHTRKAASPMMTQEEL
jgi:hypothetical protein